MYSTKQVNNIINCLAALDTTTKLYFGCDSVRIKKKGRMYGKYATVVLIHKNGNNGCRVFSHISFYPDYDLKLNRPKLRLMKEAELVAAAYNQLAPFIDEFEVEIHLDISINPSNGSFCAAKIAAGYVLGATGISPKLKPEAFAATHGADKVGKVNNIRNTTIYNTV